MSWVETHDAEFTKRLPLGVSDTVNLCVCNVARRSVEILAPNRILCGSAFGSISPVVVTRGVAEDDLYVGGHRFWADGEALICRLRRERRQATRDSFDAVGCLGRQAVE